MFKATYPYKNKNPSLTCPALNHYNQGAKVIISIQRKYHLVNRKLFFTSNSINSGEILTIVRAAKSFFEAIKYQINII